MKLQLWVFSIWMTLVAISGNAALHIGWIAGGGFVPDANDENIGILSPSYNPAGTVLAQLIFTTSSSPSLALAGPDGHPGVRPDFTSGSDEVLDSLVLNLADNGEFAQFTSTFLDPVFREGSVFVRMFGASPDSIGVGTPYYDGPLWETEFKSLGPPLEAQQVVQANRFELASGLGDALNQSVALIPEPSTFGLLALGVLGAALRRRRLPA